jgi:hypothetical protein
VNQSWESVTFTRIKHVHTSIDPEINIHTVYLDSSDSNIKEIIFKWQRQTTNVWQNDVIEGEITFTFSIKSVQANSSQFNLDKRSFCRCSPSNGSPR